MSFEQSSTPTAPTDFPPAPGEALRFFVGWCVVTAVVVILICAALGTDPWTVIANAFRDNLL